jgi:hypothetical protein
MSHVHAAGLVSTETVRHYPSVAPLTKMCVIGEALSDVRVLELTSTA